MMIIYQVINNLNKKIYIGKTVRPLDKRIYMHLYDANRGSRTVFHRAIMKYGIHNFVFDILAWCDTKDKLNVLERFYILLKGTKIPSGYNSTDGGDGGLGIIVSEETKEKMSKIRKGKKHSEETKRKMSEGRIGMKFSKEHKENMRRVRLGKNLPEKTVHKMMESHRNISHETRKKLSEATKRMWAEGRGPVCTEEKKNLLREIGKQRWWSEETRKKFLMTWKLKRESQNAL